MNRVMVLLALALSLSGQAADVTFTVRKLRTYCAACHALGELRFIRSEDDREVWDFLFHNRAPNSKKLWAEGISEVLGWPTEAPPAFNQMMKPPDLDWMPKGKKRLTLASDLDGGVSTRRRILEDLKSGALDGKVP